jgi:L-fuconolactonase
MKNIKIVDAHQHFWHYTVKDFGWINDEMKVIRRDFLPADLEPVLKKNNVAGTIIVQVGQNLEENDFMLGLAGEHAFVKGVVGWLDLQSPELESQLKKYSTNKKFAGLRHIVQGEPDDRFMLRDNFLRGISLLERYDLTYDILIYPKQLPAAIELARQFPGQKFVLDHIAKPFIKDRKIEPWMSDIKKLGAAGNVYCKVSGMVTEADFKKWKAEDLYPYLQTVLDAFGTDRLMFGSDWPVCLVAAQYEQVLDILFGFFKLPDQELNKIMSANCLKFYDVE